MKWLIVFLIGCTPRVEMPEISVNCPEPKIIENKEHIEENKALKAEIRELKDRVIKLELEILACKTDLDNERDKFRDFQCPECPNYCESE